MILMAMTIIILSTFLFVSDDADDIDVDEDNGDVYPDDFDVDLVQGDNDKQVEGGCGD